MGNKERILQRRMHFLMYNTHIPFSNANNYYDKASIAIVCGIGANNCISAPYEFKDYKKFGYIEPSIQIIILGISLGMSKKEIFDKWREQLKLYAENTTINSIYGVNQPLKEGRDNKGVYVGGGGSHGNKIRYPKKNRSKRVWKIFYTMFPWAAEKDGWDGNVSNRMK